MKKRTIKGGKCLIVLLLMLSLCGCADTELLAEIPESAAVEIGEESGSYEETAQTPPDSAPAYSFLDEQMSCYAYQNLSEAEQAWYQNIAECLSTLEADVRLDDIGVEAGLGETDIDRIFQCVLLDHPELFYVEGYTYTKYARNEQTVAIDFSGTYSMDGQQALARKEMIDSAAEFIISEGAHLTSDYDKVKYVYEVLISNTEYDLNAPDNQNIYSVFVNHKSVCQGYAKAMQYLLERMGVECALVQGSVDTGEGHAWNLVKVDGSYYYVDSTWGDASYQPDADGKITGYVPEINYDYLCVTTEQIMRTHILDSYVPMPACVDEKDNYYVRENALFTTYDREQMKALFDRFHAEGRADVTVKCADTECFEQILDALINRQEIFGFMEEGSDRIAYTHNEKQLSMTFWVTNE